MYIVNRIIAHFVHQKILLLHAANIRYASLCTSLYIDCSSLIKKILEGEGVHYYVSSDTQEYTVFKNYVFKYV